GLTASTSYSYRVRAIDAAGNLSAYSTTATATTAAAAPSAPTAAFTASPVSGTAPLTVNFASTSSGTIDTYAWTFGDGTTSTAQNPSKMYSSAGVYTVSLTVTGPGGSNTVTKANLVSVSSTPIVAGGTLIGSVTSASGTTNLSSVGSADWVQWPTNARKATGNEQIGNYAVVGAATASTYASSRRAMAWTDGSPIAVGSSKQGISISGGLGQGFQIVVPADTTTRTLFVYVGATNSIGELAAHLSDQSAPDYVSPATSKISKSWDGVYTLTYRAASPGQTLTVVWTMDTAKNPSSATVRLQGAALK
ncbi:MAG: Por secretion system C-terminal sorting protein, partial [Deltaproteobacteria bacterium]|nr:Por secretion system C-terminal sorting protein [Deltaproteobacteria bacterium]